MSRFFIPLALVLAFALPARAQQLQLEISGGLVTLDATGVTTRQILAEWARIGGTRILGGEKVTGTPLTLKLVKVPERQALDIILRNVAGFMAAPRQAAAAPGASTYDRIMIMATSTAAPTQAAAGRGNMPATNVPGPNPMNGTQRRVPIRPPNLPPAQVEDREEEQAQLEQDQDQSDTGVAAPVFTFPAPPGSGAPGSSPVFVPMNNNGAFQPGTGNTPVISLQPGPNGPTIYNFVPNPDGTPTAPVFPGTANTGFGVVGSPTPGMIQPPPTAPTPGAKPPKQ